MKIIATIFLIHFSKTWTLCIIVPSLETLYTRTNEKIITDLLPVLDSFKLSLKNTHDIKEFKKGVELIYAQLSSALEKQGLRSINSVGEQFDPYKHEVLLVEDSDKDNEVLEELLKGYMLNDKIIRHAKVKIGNVKK